MAKMANSLRSCGRVSATNPSPLLCFTSIHMQMHPCIATHHCINIFFRIGSSKHALAYVEVSLCSCAEMSPHHCFHCFCLSIFIHFVTRIIVPTIQKVRI